ncbi:phage tail protein [Yersinia ruckeri]|uniref:phage tail protein n=1 Tax=Yersinia ruckeri TaxID=29486 RepID=UPI0020C155E5|nr:phage tail protein [Yersinia ruckeri]MCK8585543.1 phage tail protein [Yersinia ruckeri]UZY11925.1 phage tail protein [Yersinia ruckeri]
MSKSIITTAFEQWKAQEAAGGNTVVLDEFVLANVPGLDPDAPIDRTEGLPPAEQIVHRQRVNKTGVVNNNAVVYSVTIGTEIGDFDFNWIGLVNQASGTVAMIVHAPTQRKIANASGQQGNALTRSFLMEYDGAASETAISIPAETWQIDFTARLTGIDEMQRLINLDHYGSGAFFADGFLVVKTGLQYYVNAGNAYVGGLRTCLVANQNITVTTKPVKVWADVSLQGNVVSQWETVVTLTLAADLQDYQDNSGFMHRVFAVASIDVAGNITDLRPKGSLGDQQGNNDFLRKDKNLADVTDKAKARKSLELKSAAQRDVGMLAGEVIEVGAFGLGLDNLVTAPDFDWNTYLFRSGEKIAITPAQVTNWPVGMDASAAYELDVACASNAGNYTIYASPKKNTLTETKLASSYEVRIVLSGKTRNFIVNEIFQCNREQMIDNGLRLGVAGVSSYSNEIFLRSYNKDSGIDTPESPVSELHMGWFTERFALRLYRGNGQDVSHIVFNFNGIDTYRFNKNGECFANGTDRIITQAQLVANKFATQKWVNDKSYATEIWVNGKLPGEATTETAGLVQLASTTGESGSRVMTQMATTTAIQSEPGLGKRQLLQDLTASRSLGVTYTNSTGYPMAVCVRVAGTTSASLYIYVNGIEFGAGHSTAMNSSSATAFSIVPHGATYSVVSAMALSKWTELR